MTVDETQNKAHQMNTSSRRHKICAALAASAALLFPAAAQAMEWTHRVDFLGEKVLIFEGKGPVVADDAERLRAKVLAMKDATGKPFSLERSVIENKRPLVSLYSDGGSVVGGIELGSFIRQSGFDTIVRADAECHSACTIAFLGGISRTVIGTYGIHAMSVDENVVRAKGGISGADLYKVQLASSILLLYTRDMLGKSDLTDAMLRIGLKTTVPVGDAELRDWNVITVASRPTQMYPNNVVATLDCAADSMTDKLYSVRRLTCKDLTFARNEVRLADALRALRNSASSNALDAEQMRWRAARDACEAQSTRLLRPSNQPLDWAERSKTYGEKSVQDCLEQIYAVRLRELEALVAYRGARDSSVAKSWHAEAK